MKLLVLEILLILEFFAALKVNIDGGDNFMDLSVEAGNEFALEWVYEYIEDQMKTVAIDNGVQQKRDSN